MKLIIAGSRSLFPSTTQISEYIQKEFNGVAIDEIVCGEAIGVDTQGKKWAKINNIPLASFPANWSLYGKSAGMIRNVEMAKYADAALVITTGSKGSAHMINVIKNLKKPVKVIEFKI